MTVKSKATQQILGGNQPGTVNYDQRNISGGIQPDLNPGRMPRPLEPVALEPTPTQKLREGMGLFLSQVACGKRQVHQAVFRLSWLQVQGV
eukprot:3333323-Amphidinium_carterae.1